MNQVNPENKPEQKNEQHQTAQQPGENQQSKVAGESQPVIKSEENQANWKAFREQREAERKAREIAERAAAEEKARSEALKAALEAITNKPAPQANYDDIEETEEQRIDKRVEAKLREREAKYEQERRQREQQELPTKINQVYPDFKNVCSNENIDYLKFHYPEVAAAYDHLPDTFETWSNVYKAIKRFVPNTDSKIDEKKADKNLQKPGSVSTPGVMQGSSAMPAARLTEERKAANWERMSRALKGLQ